MERLGGGSRTERVEAFSLLALKFIRTHQYLAQNLLLQHRHQSESHKHHEPGEL